MPRFKQNWGMGFDWTQETVYVGKSYRPIYLSFNEPRSVAIVIELDALLDYCDSTGDNPNDYVEIKATFGAGSGTRQVLLDPRQTVHILAGAFIQIDLKWLKQCVPGLPPYNHGSVIGSLTNDAPSWVEP